MPLATDAVVCGPLWLSPREMCELRIRGRPVPLSQRSLAMLAALLAADGRVVSRAELSGGAESGAGSRAVDVRVLRIRRALGSLGRYLLAIPGRGYRIDTIGLSRAR